MTALAKAVLWAVAAFYAYGALVHGLDYEYLFGRFCEQR
jgi:hypothetical protein